MEELPPVVNWSTSIGVIFTKSGIYLKCLIIPMGNDTRKRKTDKFELEAFMF